MREKHAVQATKHATDTSNDEEWAFTDSAFYFSYKVSKVLLEYWNESLAGKITCEIDCYGDFMRPLGKKATTDYLEDMSNVVQGAGSGESDITTIRKALYDKLKGFELTALPLHPVRQIS